MTTVTRGASSGNGACEGPQARRFARCNPDFTRKLLLGLHFSLRAVKERRNEERALIKELSFRREEKPPVASFKELVAELLLKIHELP